MTGNDQAMRTPMTIALKPWMHVATKRLWPVLALLMAAPGHAVERHYTGVAYAVDTDQVRYREEHWLFDDHGVRTRLVLYRCAAGQPFAKKTMRYPEAAWAPDFGMRDNRDGYREGATRAQATWNVYVKRGADSRLETARLPERTDTVVDAGFDDYVQAHWSTLLGERDLAAAFLMPGQLDYVNVKLQLAGPAVHNGAAAQRFRMRLDSWLGAIAPSVSLVYTEADHRLVQFVGPSNIRDGDGKRQRVRVEFSNRDEPVPSAAQIQAAESEELVSRCPDD